MNFYYEVFVFYYLLGLLLLLLLLLLGRRCRKPETVACNIDIGVWSSCITIMPNRVLALNIRESVIPGGRQDIARNGGIRKYGTVPACSANIRSNIV
jgi:hypothetical protein